MRSPPPWPLGHLCPSCLSPGPAFGMGTWMTQPVSGKVPTTRQDSLDGAPHALSRPAAKSPARLGPADRKT